VTAGVSALILISMLTLASPSARAASQLTTVEVSAAAPAGSFNGVAYVRIAGTVHGVVAPKEDVVGLDALPKDSSGHYAYASAFEAIVPAQGQPANEALYVDAENRGSAVSQGALGGFLQAHSTSYARVQWQTGISPGVPANAQGVGLVILRDFARWLAGRTPDVVVRGDWRPTAHSKLILGGISQSAWTVNTFIAEGFNVDPIRQTRVFDGALAIDGVGGWLAINRIAAQRGVAGQTPYLDPNGHPLSRRELLSRPRTDPIYVDVANFTDFYRLRAGLTSTPYSSPTFRRYDFPSPHAVGSAASACNDGAPITYNTLRYAPYMRALVLGLEKAIGVRAARGARSLPASRAFALGPAPRDVPWFNPLPGTAVKTPVLDANGWPKGGVRFPEADLPLGRPYPPSVSPVTTASISQTCGNSSGFQPFSPDALRAAGLEDGEVYIARYRAALDRLTAEGFLLAEDVPAMLMAARERFDAR
jgi:Alpha/beta hydrolase domain